MEFDLTDLKVRESGENTCLRCEVRVFVRHALQLIRDKENHPLGHIREAMFLRLDACVGLGNCVKECNESLASPLSYSIGDDFDCNKEHPLFKASARAASYDSDGAPWETLDMMKKGSVRFFNDEEKARMREWSKLSMLHSRRESALGEYLVSVSNPFKIKQIRSIPLSAVHPILDEAGADYSNDIIDDGAIVSAWGTSWEDGRMMVNIGDDE